jgi:hypothetical protein
VLRVTPDSNCVASSSGVAYEHPIAILKVLSSYPEGRATVAALNADLQMLASPDWFARMRALGARAGAVNLFSAKLVTRDAAGWTITAADAISSNASKAAKTSRCAVLNGCHQP